MAWVACANFFATQLNLGIRTAFAFEAIYVVGVSALLFRLADISQTAYVGIVRKQEADNSDVVRCLAHVAALHDGETAQHCERIGILAFELALEMGLPSKSCHVLRQAAVLHDLGKIGIDRKILLKPGPLNESEREVVRRHVELGAGLLEGAQHPILNVALVAISSHHEWWDGRGYPQGLSGEEIPVEGRIVAVCDVFDALATDRPYRLALEPDEAMGVLRESAGAQFDPRIVDAFERCFPRLLNIYRKTDLSPATA
jgi:putative two-component system response regulator